MTITPATFVTPIDICNRALQHLGARRITSFADASIQASEMAFSYDKLRQAELRRNTWRFSTRRAALRAMQANMTQSLFTPALAPVSGPNTGTLILTPAVWSTTTTYMPGAVVTDPNVPGLIWTSNAQENVGNTPGEGTVWDIYYGPMAVQPFDLTQSYWAGELVYITDPNSQNVNVYRSLANNNGVTTTQTVIQTQPSAGATQTTDTVSTSVTGVGNPWVLTEWNAQVTYNRDAVVVYEFTLYRSATEQNMGNLPSSSPTRWLSCGPVTAPTLAVASSTSWLPIQATVLSVIMDYPLGSGPAQEMATRNAFRLPNGYLREAPQDPKRGMVSYLGAPTGNAVKDWMFEGDYLTSFDQDPVLFRFVADIVTVSKMDPMFCEGLAARLAVENCISLTGKVELLPGLIAIYGRTMGEARIVNSIETGSDEPPEDDYITCRR